ncbi:MAG: hypothetical protein L0Y72_23840 [Gemmataceae bacterium]|nr:hypothetical protein [Gemmataceae bacterium]MCI0742077.1 hypothetical protein [Gemmataceae bacterium]
MTLQNALNQLKKKLVSSSAALAKLDSRAEDEKARAALGAALEDLKPILDDVQAELAKAAAGKAAMTAEAFREESYRLGRPCVWLREQGPEDDFAAVWGGPSQVSAPKGDYRHWLTIDCWSFKEFLHRKGVKIGPPAGCLSIYTDDDGGGVAVHDPKAKLNDKAGGKKLFAHPGSNAPPIDAIFLLGSPAVQNWLKSMKWKPEWGYNNNFKDKKPVEKYEREFQKMCPIYGNGLHGMPVYAMLGGWHFPWPDGDWLKLVKRPLLVTTFEDSEPWVEVWGSGKGFEVKQRIT